MKFNKALNETVLNKNKNSNFYKDGYKSGEKACESVDFNDYRKAKKNIYFDDAMEYVHSILDQRDYNEIEADEFLDGAEDAITDFIKVQKK